MSRLEIYLQLYIDIRKDEIKIWLKADRKG